MSINNIVKRLKSTEYIIIGEYKNYSTGKMMYKVRNVATNKISYIAKSKAKELEDKGKNTYYEQLTADNVKKHINRLNQRIREYKNTLGEATREYQNLERIAFILSNDNLTQSGYIPTNKETINRIVDNIEQNNVDYIRAFKRETNFKTIQQMMKKLNFPNTNQGLKEFIEYKEFEYAYQYRKNEFNDWWYEVLELVGSDDDKISQEARRLEKMWKVLYNMFDSDTDATTVTIQRTHSRWLNDPNNFKITTRNPLKNPPLELIKGTAFRIY